MGGVGTGLGVNPSLGLRQETMGREGMEKACQISGVKALWMERRLGAGGGLAGGVGCQSLFCLLPA